MAFVSLIFTAFHLKRLRDDLIKQKLEAIKTDGDEKPRKKKTRFPKFSFRKRMDKAIECGENYRIGRFCYKLWHEGSCENYTLKSVFGFFGGVLLTYLLYIFFIFQLNVKLTSATVVCALLGCVLTVGLAFSSKIRCIVLLTLPQFFSKRGRQALLAYAFVLALTGPARNTLNNLGILSESLACGQEQLKQAVKQIIDVVKKPFITIKEAIKKVVKTVKEVIKKIKEVLLKIKRIIMAIVRIVKSVFEFLGKLLNICNKELGTPFERCSRVFENAVADCNAKLGPLFSWLCSLAYVVKAVCYIVKIFDYVCMLVDYTADTVTTPISKKVKNFIRHIKTMFYVRIKFSHKFKYESVASKDLKTIAKEIVAEIKDRSRGVIAFFNFMTSAVMLFFLYLVFQVTYYRIRYLTSERFDNIYITKYFRAIDMRRSKMGRETVLPLTKKESVTYVPIGAVSLGKTERRKLTKAMVSLATASVKLATHIISDYCLYWILTMITYHARYQSKIQAPNLPVAHISGEGFIAKLLRVIVNAFQPVGIQLEIDTVPCLPIPIPPDYDRYIQIGVTLLFCWILTVLEPYGLRFRNYIMGYYHPLRAKQRTIWLYNHILRSRASFLLIARRQLRRKFGKGGPHYISCKELLKSKLRCGIFRICFGDLQKTCLLCGEVFRESNRNQFVKCQTPGCPGLFCLECFGSLENICPICLSPIEYGDLDNMDEEKDSSGDDQPPKKPKKDRKCKWFPCRKPPKDDDQEPLVDDDESKDRKPPEEPKEPESDSSADYSYHYQYDDVEPLPYPETRSFKDVEKQGIPDYESMETFREEEDEEELITIDLENVIRAPRHRQVQVELDITENPPDSAFVERDTVCGCSGSPRSVRQVEFIGVPEKKETDQKRYRHKIKLPSSLSECICSDLEVLDFWEDLSGVDIPKSTMSTSTRSDCKYCRAPKSNIISALDIGPDTEDELRNIVPELDLSFLDTEKPKTFTDRFANVKFEETCETPLTNRTLDSSSVLSSLRGSTTDSDRQPLLRRRPTKNRQQRFAEHGETSRRNEFNSDVDSPSSMDSYEFNKILNKKVKRYYESTKKYCNDQKCQYSQKRRSFANMLKKLLPKRKKKNYPLPLLRRDLNESDEEEHQDNSVDWDSLDVGTDSPTYPFGSHPSTDTLESHPLLGNKRIRGGQCPHRAHCGNHCKQNPPFLKNQTQLKDFATLSLPAKPKPANVADLLSRHLLSLEDLTPTKDPGFSMTATGSTAPHDSKLQPSPEETSDFILSKEAARNLATLQHATPPSSESGLSEGICLALFGKTCPKGIGREVKRLMQSDLEEISSPETNIDINTPSTVSDNHNSVLLLTPTVVGDKKQSSLETQKVLRSKDPLNQKEPEAPEDQVKASSRVSVHTAIGSKQNSIGPVEQPTASNISDEPSTLIKVNNLDENQVHKTEPETVDKPKRPSNSKVDRLIYKDDKTEINLVKDLRSSSSKFNIATNIRKTPTKPALKLQISLHNTLIPEDTSVLDSTNKDTTLPDTTIDSSQTLPNMDSPQSKDKVVETVDTFPFNPWTQSTPIANNGKSGRIVLSRDNTQQTSDNDFYPIPVKTDRAKDSTRPCYCPPSAGDSFKTIHTREPHPQQPIAQYSTTGSYYSYEIPERDSNHPNQCTCPNCYAGFGMSYDHNPNEQVMTHGNRKQFVEFNTVNESMCTCCQCSQLHQTKPPYKKEGYRPPSPPPFDRSGEIMMNADYPRVLPPNMHKHATYSRSPPRRHPPRSNNKNIHNDCDCWKPQYAFHPKMVPPYNDRHQFHDQMTADETESNMHDNLEGGNSLTDLPYQNNDDYLELVEELQDTLHSRNRNRVRKAMQEFEIKSKQNQPLEKPIINYDEASESEEPIIKRITEMKSARRTCCAGDKCTCYAHKDLSRSHKPKDRTKKDNNGNPIERPSHWTMDPASGEWFKGCKCAKYRGPKNKNYPEQNQCSCCATRYQ
ncbi:hypothetical protein GWI33_008203 [Rhynchophorus ferrugineus]|uniref:RING-type domain-containing protein n=1 Tax=Rhynchophorus ferrugineus TaxID=354439 RepID=A0A834IF14_RHYFE|nr:hypothetical protein GWI33_008203 [Rhynchophorus ferrugineus]